MASTGRFTAGTLTTLKDLVGTLSSAEGELMGREYSFDRSSTSSG